MKTAMTRSLFCLFGCAAAVCCAGRSDSLKTAGADATTGEDILDFRALADRAWEVVQDKEGGAPPARIPQPRVAIAEFTVEYVDGGSGPSPDLGAGVRLILPTVLHEAFAALLPDFDRSVVPGEEVTAARAYGRLKGRSSTDIEVVEGALQDIAGVRFPSSGLLALDDAQEDADAVLRELLDEIGADTALQIRLRVGVRDGRATLEKGSVYRAVTRSDSGLLRARLTLVSPLTVVEGEADGTAAVSSSRYVKALRGLFRPSIALAIVAAGGVD